LFVIDIDHVMIEGIRMWNKHRRNLVFSIIPGVIIAGFITIGAGVKREHSFSFGWEKLALILVLSVVINIMIFIAYKRIDACFSHQSKKNLWINRVINKAWKYYLLMTALLMILWIPAFLAFYPGLFVYDAQWQYYMYIEGAVTAHHPAIHTYLLGWIIDSFHKLTGSINKGIAAYTVVQMILMALGCGVVFYVLYNRSDKMWKHIFAFCFYAFFPVWVIFVFSATKDSFFAIAVADFVVLNLCLIDNPKAFFDNKVYVVLWIVFAFLVASLRNNAIYALVPGIPFFIIYICKSCCDKKRAFAMLIITALLYVLYRYPITNAITVEGTSKAEMLSVPCQQIMRVNAYHREELSLEEKNAIDELFDHEKWYGYYVPEIADATKGSLRMEIYENDSSVFWNLWKDLLKKYPGEYVDSFLENTYGFWYPWPRYVIYSFGDEGYTPVTCMGPGEVNSKLSGLLSIYKNFENGDIVQKNTWISWLFAPATYMYIALVIAFYLLKERMYGKSLPILFLALLWCTFLLGPVAMVRYALYLYALIPVWPMYLVGRSKELK